jgi:hypothetical protein
MMILCSTVRHSVTSLEYLKKWAHKRTMANTISVYEHYFHTIGKAPRDPSLIKLPDRPYYNDRYEWVDRRQTVASQRSLLFPSF